MDKVELLCRHPDNLINQHHLKGLRAVVSTAYSFSTFSVLRLPICHLKCSQKHTLAYYLAKVKVGKLYVAAVLL